MALTLSFSIEGEKQFSRKLEGISTSLKDFTEPLTNIGENLVTLFGGNVFLSKGAEIGERWAPLAASTLAKKRRSGYSLEPLIATGSMQDGFRSIVSSDQVVIGNTTAYFKYHQSNKPRSKIPRRVMMKIDNKRKEMIQKEFQKYIMKNITK